MIKVKSKPKENANTVRKKNRWKDFRDNAELSALMIPGIVLLLVFAYVPMLGIIIAFKDYRNNLGIFKSKWVGFQNFKFFFASQVLVRRHCLLWTPECKKGSSSTVCIPWVIQLN